MTLVYPVILTAIHDKNDTYLVDIPDLDGTTEGYGLADAINMARDYIGLSCYFKKNNQFPKASDIENINVRNGRFYNEGHSLITLVDVDISKFRRSMDNRAVRKNVSLPGWLSDLADEECINVSRILQDALMDTLQVTRESHMAKHKGVKYKILEQEEPQLNDNI